MGLPWLPHFHAITIEADPSSFILILHDGVINDWLMLLAAPGSMINE